MMAFATTLFVFSLYELNTRHVGEVNGVLGLSLFTGGLATFMAGMWHFPRGNGFGAAGAHLFELKLAAVHSSFLSVYDVRNVLDVLWTLYHSRYGHRRLIHAGRVQKRDRHLFHGVDDGHHILRARLSSQIHSYLKADG
jgi:hypothetical protein